MSNRVWLVAGLAILCTGCASSGKYKFMHSVWKGDLTTAMQMLDQAGAGGGMVNGEMVNIDLALAFTSSPDHCQPALAEAFISRGANPNDTRFNHLFAAANEGCADVAAVLLKHGADLNRSVTKQNYYEYSGPWRPIDEALLWGNRGTAQFLKALGNKPAVSDGQRAQMQRVFERNCGMACDPDPTLSYASLASGDWSPLQGSSEARRGDSYRQSYLMSQLGPNYHRPGEPARASTSVQTRPVQQTPGNPGTRAASIRYSGPGCAPNISYLRPRLHEEIWNQPEAQKALTTDIDSFLKQPGDLERQLVAMRIQRDEQVKQADNARRCADEIAPRELVGTYERVPGEPRGARETCLKALHLNEEATMASDAMIEAYECRLNSR